MPNFKKALDRDFLSDETKIVLENTTDTYKKEYEGVACDNLTEPVPQYLSSPCELVVANKNNSWIILGRDRPASRLSGYGGRGDSQAASVDIVVGRLACDGIGAVNSNNEELLVDPSFEKDAARFFISQKADIDDYLKINGQSHKTRSAAAIKADHVRVVAREKIKLVTGTDQKNSQGADVNELSGIEINAGNDEESLQPMTLGNNVVSALDGLVRHMDSLAGLLDSFLMVQMEYNNYIASHHHISPFFAIPNTPSEVLVPAGQQASLNLLQKVKRGILNLKINLGSYKITHLEQIGKNYICSRRNKVN